MACTGMGLALGGGIGYLMRAYGLAADNIIKETVVLANGTEVKCLSISEVIQSLWC